jgi:hypothetical protein
MLLGQTVQERGVGGVVRHPQKIGLTQIVGSYASNIFQIHDLMNQRYR